MTLGPRLPHELKVGRYEEDEDGNPVLVTAVIIHTERSTSYTRYFLEGHGPRGRWWKLVTVSKFEPENLDPNPWRVLHEGR